MIKGIGPRRLREKEVRFNITIEDPQKTVTIVEELKKHKYKIQRVKIKDNKSTIILELFLMVKGKIPYIEVYHKVKSIDDVNTVDVE